MLADALLDEFFPSGAGTPGPGGGSAAPDTGTQPAVAGLTEAEQAAAKLAEQILGQTPTPATSSKPATPAASSTTPADANQMTPERAAAANAKLDELLDEFFPDDDILSDIVENAE